MIEKFKALKNWQKWAIALLLLAIIGFIVGPQNTQPELKKEPILTQAQIDSIAFAKTIEKGKVEAVVNLRVYIKKSLNDPKSFDVLNQKTWAVGNTIMVMIEYTAKNAFGGVVKKTIQAEADINGKLLKVFDK